MKITFLLLFLVTFINSAIAQIPQGINYQGVARNALGKPLINQNIGIKISIFDSATTNLWWYSETHSVTTNAMGLYNLIIGKGTATMGKFDTINWSNGDKWMQIQIDPVGGTNYVISGNLQLMSVPFALYSGKSNSKGADGKDGTGIIKSEVIGDSLYIKYTDGRNENAGSVASKVNEVIYLYINNFGAKPDDSNFDNSSAFQAAVDSAVKTGKILFIGKGKYYISKTIYIRKYFAADHDEGIKILGSGIGISAIVSKVKNQPLFVIENALVSNANPIPGYFFQGGYIKNILIQGTAGTGNALNISGWWYGLLENVKIMHFGGNAIHMPTRNNFGPPNDIYGNAYTDNYSSFISIKNSIIQNNDGWGYFDERDNTSSDLNADKTVFASNGAGGIRFGGQSIRITGCAIAYNGYKTATGGGLELGVNGNSSHNNFITQVEFDANNQYHIKMNSVINTTVTSCRFLFHDLIDSAKICPYKGGILLAADSLYPYAANTNITNNYIRVDYPTKAFSNRQQLYFLKFLSHASTQNIKIENNFYQQLPSGFTAYHDFIRYDYYFTSRLGIEYNIVINDPQVGVFNPSAHGKLPPYIDGAITNSSIDTSLQTIKYNLPITYGGNNLLNLSEYAQFYDTSNGVFTIPESGYYEISITLNANTTTSITNFTTQYFFDYSKNTEHNFQFPSSGNITVNDKIIYYFYKGLRLELKCKSSATINLINNDKGKIFLKMLN